MEAMVGARLEVVAPPKITDVGERLRLGGLLLVALAIHGWLLTHTTVTARDGIGFARIALQIEHPNLGHPAGAEKRSIVNVFREAQHPPAYPITVWLVSLPIRYLSDAELPAEMLLATQVASAIAGILLIFPVYGLGRMLFGKFAGFAAAAMVQCLPVFARVTSDGLTEGLYLFTLATGVFLGARAVREPSVGNFLLCGLVTGLAYLVRPEGLLIGLGTGFVGFALGAVGRWPRGQSIAQLTALGVGIFLAAAPYMLLIGGLTNKSNPGMIFESIRQKVIGEVNPGIVEGPLLAAWYVPGEDGSKTVWAVGAILKEGMKAAHYLPAILALGGLWAVRRRLWAEPWFAVPIVCIAINVAIIAALVSLKVDAAGRSYVSERHMMPIALIGIIFAAGFLEPLGRMLSEKLGLNPMVIAGGILLAICISGLPGIFKPLHDNRAGHLHAGRWLREHAQPGDTIVDPFEWAQFFAGRTLYDIPADPQGSKVIYAVLEGPSEDDPNSHLPRHAAAAAVARDGRSRLVYHWPEDQPIEQSEIRIIRLEQQPRMD